MITRINNNLQVTAITSEITCLFPKHQRRVHIPITEKGCMWSISIFVGYLLKHDRIAKGRTSHKKDNGKHKLFLNDLEPISKYLGIF